MPTRDAESEYERLIAAMGARIRRRRRNAHITQERLAYLAGIGLRMLQLCEQGKRCPSLKTLWRLGLVLRTSPRAFLPTWSRY